MAQYPDDTQIPLNLPPSYRQASTFIPQYGEPKTIGESCKNCNHYSIGHCNWWDAEVRNNYYCSEWAKIERIKK